MDAPDQSAMDRRHCKNKPVGLRTPYDFHEEKGVESFFGTASARTSDPGASIGRVCGRTIQMRERINRRSRCDA
jgi:hypothetical protein